MGIVEYTLALLAVLFIIVKYMMVIQDASLMERYHLIEKVKKIIDENDLDDQKYHLLARMVKFSSDSLFLPKLVIYGIFKKNKSPADNELSALFDSIKKDFFAVNFIAGLHWYVLGGVVLASFALIIFLALLPFIAFSTTRRAFKVLYGIEHRAHESKLYPYAIARMA